MKKYQKYDVATGQEFVGDIQTEDIQLANSLICELDGANIGTIAIDDVVYILGNGKIIKAIANNAYCNYQLGIVKAINGTSYTVQVDGIVEHSQLLTNDLSKEVYATSDKSGRNLVDKLEVPFFNDDTAVIVGKKLSSNKIKLSPEFFIFGDPEPNFLNDESLRHWYPLNATNTTQNLITGKHGSNTGCSLASGPFGVAESAYQMRADNEDLTIRGISIDNFGDCMYDGANSKFTVSLWVNFYMNNTSDNYWFGHVGGNYRFFFYKQSLIINNSVSNSINPYGYGYNRWQNLIWTCDMSLSEPRHNIYKLHDNSKTKLTLNFSSQVMSPTTSIIWLGRSGGGDISRGLIGAMSSIRVYNKVWAEKEVDRYQKYCNTWQVAA